MERIQNHLFILVIDKDDSEKIAVEPTEYLAKLAPHEAIHELRAYVEKLAEEIEKLALENLDVQKNLENLQQMTTELEIAQAYLSQVFESWKASQAQA